jgi:hypothetical protein
MDIHFTDGTSYERAAPLVEKNATARQHVPRSLITLRRHFSPALAQPFRKKFRR